MGAIAISAYSYMALVPVIQPPIMRWLTNDKERRIRMRPPRVVTHREKVLLPILIGLDYEGHVPTCDTLSIDAVFAPVRDGDTLQYVSGTQISRIWDNTSDTATFYRWGAKFDPSVLNGVTEIPQVEACLEPDFDGTVSIPCTYTIELWQGGDESPQNQIYTQNYIVPGEGARWRLIRFNNPVPIDSTQPLWVILSCTMTLSWHCSENSANIWH